ncbi:hypothetical protein E2562_012113 [Oryza meyeriana var. granulata]|uniref:Uncharacterized protein n=1 Tax=Oryza meyeriana var. granulata TaxID=110450 RepID=A0A6G1F775_9ORYZ|nr:hypothetical protein E2562_012113 [Oryza meyeriana var. granulata]
MQPLDAAYALFFVRHLLVLAYFFCPLLVTTSLLLAVLVTVGPYVGGGGELSPGVRSLGWTCGIAVGAPRAQLRANGAGAGAGGGAVALLGQLCSFVLCPDDTAAVLRIREIMGVLKLKLKLALKNAAKTSNLKKAHWLFTPNKNGKKRNSKNCSS